MISLPTHTCTQPHWWEPPQQHQSITICCAHGLRLTLAAGRHPRTHARSIESNHELAPDPRPCSASVPPAGDSGVFVYLCYCKSICKVVVTWGEPWRFCRAHTRRRRSVPWLMEGMWRGGTIEFTETFLKKKGGNHCQFCCSRKLVDEGGSHWLRVVKGNLLSGMPSAAAAAGEPASFFLLKSKGASWPLSPRSIPRRRAQQVLSRSACKQDAMIGSKKRMGRGTYMQRLPNQHPRKNSEIACDGIQWASSCCNCNRRDLLLFCMCCLKGAYLEAESCVFCM
jgi:hypothetical protein